MVCWWKFNEKSGETAGDSSGNKNSAKLNNGPVWRSSGGKFGGALEFDGIDDYVQTADSEDKLQLKNDYTLSVWLKADFSQKHWTGIISKCNTSGSNNQWTLQFNDSANPRIIIYHPSEPWETGITLKDIAGDWHHIVVVRKASIMKSYLDTTEFRRGEFYDNPGRGKGHLNIGTERKAVAEHVYKGLIDDIRVYDYALSSEDITAVYAGKKVGKRRNLIPVLVILLVVVGVALITRRKK